MPEAPDPLLGRTLAHYRIDERLGEGGMGVVYRATDLRLERSVALKVLDAQGQQDEERRRRFLREARAASVLSHPGIVTVHEVDSIEGLDFIVMELVPGRSLLARLASGQLPPAEAVDLGSQLAAALAAAHEHGVVHRDVKPGNLIVTPTGRLKVVDFGLARAAAPAQPPDSEEITQSRSFATRPGSVLGTLAYMSPEQVRGEPVGPASDVFAMGIVLYEMITARRPFAGPTAVSTLAAILEHHPPPVDLGRPDAPRGLADIVEACLEKDPSRRPSAGEVGQRLGRLPPRAAEPASLLRALGRPRAWLPLAAFALLASAAGVLLWKQSARRAWSRASAPAEIRRLVGEGSHVAAFRLAREALALAPNDPQILQEWLNLSVLARIDARPVGASIEYTNYKAELPWVTLGRAPIEKVRVPLFARWRVSSPGYDTLEAHSEELAGDDIVVHRFNLEPSGIAPPGMVRVPEGLVDVRKLPRRQVPEYWIDRFEVTNREFKAFVDAGGYRDRRYWAEPFRVEGRTLSFEEVAPRFVDTTGRPGAATWELGAPPEGKQDLPVGGVSFYEALAYARFAGKELPTVFHWARAAGWNAMFSDILDASNFSGKGEATALTYRGVGPFGTYDMAGNVKEWVWNASDGKRCLLGGAWNEPPYTFHDLDARDPLERRPQNGLRCVRSVAPLPSDLLAPVVQRTRDFEREAPASNEVFAAYARLYAYDRGPLAARLESTDDANPHWRREAVSFAAAYANERVPAYVFVPRNSRPPYQAVVFHPGGDALYFTSSRNLWLQWADFVVRSGRVVVYPILQGTYERQVPMRGKNTWRDAVVQRAKDVGRTVDYLIERRDVDAARIAYYGLSLGAQSGLTAAAVEPRFRTVVLAAGGLHSAPDPPEVDEFHFAPRIRVPTLMINGRDDFTAPLKSEQLPLFRWLGAPPERKRHVLLDGGHIPPRMQDVIREILDWLDAQLGPVQPAPAPGGGAGAS